MLVVSVASAYPGGTVTPLIHAADYNPVPLVLTLTCPLSKTKTSVNITSASNSTDYYYFSLPFNAAGQILST